LATSINQKKKPPGKKKSVSPEKKKKKNARRPEYFLNSGRIYVMEKKELLYLHIRGREKSRWGEKCA